MLAERVSSITPMMPTTTVQEFWGVDINKTFGLTIDSYIVTQYNIKNLEFLSGVKPGHLCVETAHGSFKDVDALLLPNFICSIQDGFTRRYYFRTVAGRTR